MSRLGLRLNPLPSYDGDVVADYEKSSATHVISDEKVGFLDLLYPPPPPPPPSPSILSCVVLPLIKKLHTVVSRISPTHLLIVSAICERDCEEAYSTQHTARGSNGETSRSILLSFFLSTFFDLSDFSRWRCACCEVRLASAVRKEETTFGRGELQVHVELERAVNTLDTSARE